MTDFNIQAAEATNRMRKLFPATPLQRNDHLSNVYDADIWLENACQPLKKLSWPIRAD